MNELRAGWVAVAVLLGLAAPAMARPPTDPEVKKAVEAVFDAAPEGRAAALAALTAFDDLTAAEVEAWRKPLLALSGRGPKARPQGGRNWFWPKEQRGLFVVGGSDGGKGLVLALHGGGEGAGDAGQAASAFGGAASALKLRLAAPEVLQKTERGWTDPEETERFVVDLVETLKRAWKVDANRVYLTGHSMGGYGTWTIGAVHADLFAGLAAFAGAPTCERETTGGPLVAVEDGVLPNLRNLPIFVYQSLDDRNVPPESNEFAVKELAALRARDPGGWEHRYERVDGRGHAFPEKGPQPGLAWAAGHARDPRPKKVVWQPTRAWKRSFYWLWWERPVLGTTVTVLSKGDNRFEVEADGAADGLEILLDARQADLDREVVVTAQGKEVFRGVPKRSLSTMVGTALERNDPDLLFSARVPASAR